MSTPGPWAIFTIASPAGVSYRIHAGNKDIAHIAREWAGDGSNAELIAAAPTMHTQLREIAAFLNRMARRIDPRSQSCRHIDKDELEKAADDCHKMVAKLRGET